MDNAHDSQLSPGVAASAELGRGRELYDRRAWADAHRSLGLADQHAPLGGDDLERLAMAAYLIGRDDECLRALERAHQVYLEAQASVRAARCAFLMGFRLAGQGEMGRATGWFARAGRLLEEEARDCVEQGYLLLPMVLQHLAAANCEAAYATAGAAAEIGNRFGESDLIAYARHLQGRALLALGKTEQGLALLDEAMVAVSAGELSPLFTGLIYCSVIDGCRQVFALGRAREWTAALAEWCERNPQMVAYTGSCLVHRAAIMQLHGAWGDALEEARQACDRFARGIDTEPPGAAFYQLAEVHRLRGAFVEAEEAYRQASQWGREPQPGLALLRLAEGRMDAAAAAIRRVVNAAADPLHRARLLPAHVEILLAMGEVQEARGACLELAAIAERAGTAVLDAMAAHARGAVALAEGDAPTALASLRHACGIWQQVEAPYEVALVRALAGVACRALGDLEGAGLEFEAAEGTFVALGAVPDVARIRKLTRDESSRESHALTARELQVVRLLAAGKTNKAIGAELQVSEKTVERHVSNIFTKLGVSSRAAATAHAYTRRLI